MQVSNATPTTFQTFKKTRKRLILESINRFLGTRTRLEPGWIAPLVFETSASTYSAIWA